MHELACVGWVLICLQWSVQTQRSVAAPIHVPIHITASDNQERTSQLCTPDPDVLWKKIFFFSFYSTAIVMPNESEFVTGVA